MWSSDRDRFEIQTNDGDSRFNGDDEAEAFVKAQADKGSTYHIEALEIIAKEAAQA
jgi:hypothetical protein